MCLGGTPWLSSCVCVVRGSGWYKHLLGVLSARLWPEFIQSFCAPPPPAACGVPASLPPSFPCLKASPAPRACWLPTSPLLSPQATTHVYVTVVDENDNAPEFQQPHYEIVLDEGPDTVNTSLITVQALDLDEGPNGTVTYAIVGGNIINTFHINRRTVRGRVFRDIGWLGRAEIRSRKEPWALQHGGHCGCAGLCPGQ